MWITGQVVDEGGRLLSEVMIEVSGPAARQPKTTMTNKQGQYTVLDLCPGIYEMRFARAGFSTVLRHPVELLSGFVATVNARLKTEAA